MPVAQRFIHAANLWVIDMSGQEILPEQPGSGWRLKIGSTLLLLSIVLPLVGVPLTASLDMSAMVTTSVSGVLLIGGEVLGVVAVAVMGKSGYVYIKNCVFGFLKQYGPPRKVGRLRYTIGLMMFSVPILFGWMSPYLVELTPSFTHNQLPYALGGDILFLTSLFVLGGDFWDKVRALFVHDAEIRFPQR
jgi:hypothetical protein